MAGERRSLYRHFLRTFSPLPTPVKLNLIRHFRPHLRSLFQTSSDLPSLKQQITSTSTLLASSPSLTRALSSLHYHHYPHPIPRTPVRITPSTSPLPPLPPFTWIASDPKAAQLKYEAEVKKWKKDKAKKFREEALNGLNGLMLMVEGNEGVVLGRFGR